MAYAARHLLVSRPAAVLPPVAGYVAWYDSSQITGLADGAALTSWPDASGNGHTLTQSTSGTIYYSSTAAKLINGKPAVWFTSQTGSNMVSAAFAINQPFTVFAVFGLDDWGYAVQSANGNVFIGVSTLSGMWTMNAGAYLTGLGATLNNAPHLLSGVYNGASSILAVDSTQYSGNPGSNAMGNIVLGSVVSGNSGITGPLTEVLIYPSALSPANVASVSSYLKTKWGTP